VNGRVAIVHRPIGRRDQQLVVRALPIQGCLQCFQVDRLRELRRPREHGGARIDIHVPAAFGAGNRFRSDPADRANGRPAQSRRRGISPGLAAAKGRLPKRGPVRRPYPSIRRWVRSLAAGREPPCRAAATERQQDIGAKVACAGAQLQQARIAAAPTRIELRLRVPAARPHRAYPPAEETPAIARVDDAHCAADLFEFRARAVAELRDHALRRKIKICTRQHRAGPAGRQIERAAAASSRLRNSGSNNRHPGKEMSRAHADAVQSSDCKRSRPCALPLILRIPRGPAVSGH